MFDDSARGSEATYVGFVLEEVLHNGGAATVGGANKGRV